MPVMYWTDDPVRDAEQYALNRDAWERQIIRGYCEYCGEPIYAKSIYADGDRYIQDDHGKIVCARKDCMKRLFQDRGELLEMLIDEFTRKGVEDYLVDDDKEAEQWLFEQAEEKGWVQG